MCFIFILPRLYNKETVLMTLLDKTNIPDIAKHLRSLKVNEVKDGNVDINHTHHHHHSSTCIPVCIS